MINSLTLKVLIFRTMHNYFLQKRIKTEIYEYVPRSADYPFVQLGEVTTQDNSTKTNHGQVMFQKINIFDQAKSSAKIIQLSELIIEALNEMELDDFYLRTQFINSELRQKADGQTTYLTMKFKFIIME
jgi:hypothetical protein